MMKDDVHNGGEFGCHWHDPKAKALAEVQAAKTAGEGKDNVNAALCGDPNAMLEVCCENGFHRADYVHAGLVDFARLRVLTNAR
ncbi:hypothetical protein TcWFU_008705 [Taenia crassiceps]|uniref:Uncharacterized protein n=1 Tax=Taenia crassiceps TaxID=6207 RepID=A0ABR4QMI3_9CEST